ncbi:MAG TPA: sulfate ABC transporter ATP-binding protein [Phycisphaerae bacterium]|nr:sulfate ABC transporter ATP-binding protein [Phycisphaerae bacterium]HNU47054.1 sulfate ABC transporter ATP-binding protein [Phycisphaerae bacterium]
MSIEALGISKHFGAFAALKDVSLRVETGELVALLGPSGSGKTTLLRIISGLEKADAGAGMVRLHGEDVTTKGVGYRRVGFVFQHYALFRHMTVFENIAFGLRVKRRSQRASRQQIREKVEQLLRLVQLEWLAGRYPAQLSGGQRQRIALARALAIEPQVLLLDEPFGALDAKTRQELRRWLRRLHAELHVTSVLVTHDQEEALEVADRVAIMNAGRMEQFGTPAEVFHHPANEFVMNFLGHVNVFHGRVEGGRAILGPMEIDYSGRPHATTVPARGLVRPYDLEIEHHPNGKPGFAATVCHINSAGPRVKIDLTAESGEAVHVELAHERFRALALEAGQQVFVVPREVNVFVDEGQG